VMRAHQRAESSDGITQHPSGAAEHTHGSAPQLHGSTQHLHGSAQYPVPQPDRSGLAETGSRSEVGSAAAEPSTSASGGASLVRTVAAVGASFFGVRGRKDHETDLAHLKPVHLVLAGLMMAGLFVLTLLGVVAWVLRS